MKAKKNVNFFQQLPLGLKIISIPVICVFLLAITFLVYFKIWTYKNLQTEKIIEQKFWPEVSQIPQIRVKSFQLWEGDSMVTAEILNKGEVRFWYGKNGVPRIEVLGSYSTSYSCFYVDKDGKKVSHAFSTSLVLDKDKKFARWFPFEVNNLQNLVDKYDAIASILKTLPQNPDLVLKQQVNGKEVWCDL